MKNTDLLTNTLIAHRGLHNINDGIPENSIPAFKRAINKWRLNIQITFNIDPLKCPNCDTIMIYTESIWWGA